MGLNFVSAKMILDSALLFILFSVLFPCQFAFASVGSKMITVDQEKKQQQQLIQIDISSLLAFKRSILSDPYHTLDNWNPAVTHVCNWTGISCTPGLSRVEKLNLAGSDLVARCVGAELGNLSGLQYLDISVKSFTGQIPPELGKLDKLEGLSLSFNNIAGNIPSQLGMLKNLHSLSLQNKNMSNLLYLNLGHNRLIGTIPPSWKGINNFSFVIIGT
jgi:LRR receptor-like serine/threonine-protein kinase FLS2